MYQHITNNLDKIILEFGLNLEENGKYYVGACPIHNGDNPTALNIYKTGHTLVGNWVCNTHQCQKKFGKSIIGFIRGLLSKDRLYSVAETIGWCEKFFNIKANDQAETKDKITYLINSIYNKQDEPSLLKINIDDYFNSGLEFPDNYFLTRGYSKETLNYFGIGYCNNPNKPMYKRSIVPLFSQDGKYVIGCSGRITTDQCSICGNYHSSKQLCPTNKQSFLYSKWKHSKNFPAKNYLYNFNNAKKEISKSGIVIITEGQPNVWRLYEAGFEMSVCCFGTNFTPEHKKMLDISGANTIIIVPDADEASKNFVKNINEKCKKSYNIVTVEPAYEDDIGQCNVETVKKLLLPFLEKYRE